MSELVPKLRFKAFTEHWVPTTVGSLIDTFMGFAFKSSDFVNTGTQLIRMSNLYQGTLKLSRSPVYLPNAFKSNHSKYVVKKGDLLMSMTGTVGKRDYGYVIKVNESNDFFLNQRVMKISVKQQTNQNYIQYLLTDERFLNRLYSLPGGTKQANLSADQLKSVSITVPTNKQEQQKIADFLTSVDIKISQLTEKHRLLTQYKKGVMQQIFSQQLRFKDDDGNEFGEWENHIIGDIMQESRIKGSGGDTAKKLTVKIWGKGVIPKKEGIVGSENTQYYKRKSGQFIYGKLDFLNCAFAIIPPELDGYESTLDLPSLDVSSSVNKFFILAVVTQKWFYKKYGEIADGSRKAKRINVGVFQAMPIKLPVKNEQDKIMSFLQAIDAKIDATSQQLEQTKLFKKGLLQQMFV